MCIRSTQTLYASVLHAKIAIQIFWISLSNWKWKLERFTSPHITPKHIRKRVIHKMGMTIGNVIRRWMQTFRSLSLLLHLCLSISLCPRIGFCRFIGIGDYFFCYFIEIFTWISALLCTGTKSLFYIDPPVGIGHLNCFHIFVVFMWTMRENAAVLSKNNRLAWICYFVSFQFCKSHSKSKIQALSRFARGTMRVNLLNGKSAAYFSR